MHFVKLTKMNKITVTVVRDGKWYVATCSDPDIASQGRTQVSALRQRPIQSKSRTATKILKMPLAKLQSVFQYATKP